KHEAGVTASLAGVYFVDPAHGWVVGGGGTILATLDGGATWWRRQSGTGNSLAEVQFADAKHGIAVGREGTILLTADGGSSWQEAGGPDAAGQKSDAAKPEGE